MQISQNSMILDPGTRKKLIPDSDPGVKKDRIRISDTDYCMGRGRWVGLNQWVWTRIQETITASREKWNLGSLLWIFLSYLDQPFVFIRRFMDLVCIWPIFYLPSLHTSKKMTSFLIYVAELFWQDSDPAVYIGPGSAPVTTVCCMSRRRVGAVWGSAGDAWPTRFFLFLLPTSSGSDPCSLH